jgi:hypothetical protein
MLEKQAIEKIAACWRREYGENVEWHLSAKIKHLECWGDREGSCIYERVLTRVHATSAKPFRKPKLM